MGITAVIKGMIFFSSLAAIPLFIFFLVLYVIMDIRGSMQEEREEKGNMKILIFLTFYIIAAGIALTVWMM